MTIEGAIVELQNLIDNDGIPFWAKPSLQKVLETVEAEREEHLWIPVTERLPEELVPVNITWVNHNPESYHKHIKDKPFTATGVYFYGQWYWWSTLCTDFLAEYGHNNGDMADDDIEITAWMPLPKPYELIDSDRSLRGDYFKKPTQYWFVNFNPRSNFVVEPITYVETGTKDKPPKSINDLRRATKRSMISPHYARRFILERIVEESIEGSVIAI